MKKMVFMLILLLFITPCYAATKQSVTFVECVDGDTAKVKLKKEEIKIRFLAIDTPETSHPTKGEEPFGKEAKEYTCNALKKAKKIQIEFDDNSDKTDKYDRYLVWVWVDDYLLQDNLVKEGLAEVAYLYGDYKYTPLLKDHQAVAEASKVGIWSGKNTIKEKNKYDNLYLVGGLIGILILTATGIITKKQGKSYAKKIIKKYGK